MVSGRGPVAIPLRGYRFATRWVRALSGLEWSGLQSPCGAIGLRQHTPLNAVLYRAGKGGIYEKVELSTGSLWISGQKVGFCAMAACKSTLLDFLSPHFAMLIARTLCQEPRRKPPTRALYHFAQNRIGCFTKALPRRPKRAWVGVWCGMRCDRAGIFGRSEGRLRQT